MPQAKSVEPTPVANAPNAPYVQVWESAPIIKSPAVTIPFSGSNACSIPILPTSKKFSKSCSLANSLNIFTCSADLISLFGTKWSGTNTHLVLSKTFLAPVFLNSLTATGPVISFAKVISSFAVINCPGLTSSSPACAARIFSGIFIGLVIISSFFCLYKSNIIINNFFFQFLFLKKR